VAADKTLASIAQLRHTVGGAQLEPAFLNLPPSQSKRDWGTIWGTGGMERYKNPEKRGK
jgi:hypothetical protein